MLCYFVPLHLPYMQYLKSYFFKIQIAVQVLLIALYLLLPHAYKDQVMSLIALILLLLVGIPHGANDLLYRKEKTLKGAAVFLFFYLGVMALYGLLWWWQPAVALAVFLIISVHHFGQSNFESDKKSFAPSWLWGLWLLVAPVSIHYQESIDIFAQMIHTNTLAGSYENLALLTRYVLLLIYLIVAIFYVKKAWLEVLAQALLIALWYELSGLLAGFIIVFTLWHSSQSLFFQAKHYSNMQSPKPSVAFFVVNMMVFTLIAALFVYGISLFIPMSISVLFILLSIVTLPHVVVMDGIYKAK